MTEEKTTEEKQTKTGSLAVILVRGLINVKKPVRDTLKLLRLVHKNHCTVIEDNPINQGMLKKVKDYITWGKINEKTFLKLIEKKGQPYLGPETCSKDKIKYKKFFIHNNKKYKKYFRLNPPRKGFGRKGIKIPFKVGGALGYRGEKINELIERMI